MQSRQHNNRSSTWSNGGSCIIAKNYGIQHVFFLTNRVSLHQVFKLRKSTDWLDSSKIAYLNFPSQNGLFCNTIVVPRVVVKAMWCFAKQAMNTPLYYRWYNPALYNHVWTLPLFGIKKKKKKNCFLFFILHFLRGALFFPFFFGKIEVLILFVWLELIIIFFFAGWER